MDYFESKVVGQEQLTDDIFVLKVERRDAVVAAGQFFMLKCWDNELTLI